MLFTHVAQRIWNFFLDVSGFLNLALNFELLVSNVVSCRGTASTLKAFEFTSGYLSLHPELVGALFFPSDSECLRSALQTVHVAAHMGAFP